MYALSIAVHSFSDALAKWTDSTATCTYKTDSGPFWSPFFFWFQRGLGEVTALQRLPKQSKLVSEPHLSLIDRPMPSEGRFPNSV